MKLEYDTNSRIYRWQGVCETTNIALNRQERKETEYRFYKVMEVKLRLRRTKIIVEFK